METYLDAEGLERCDSCDELTEDCTCVCDSCGDNVQECCCDE